MSLLYFTGFDNFGSAFSGGSPVHGAGITGTPVNLTPLITGASLIGVSGLAGDKFGASADLRNGLVFYKSASVSQQAQVALTPSQNWRTNVERRYTYGFSFKEVGAANPATNVALLQLAGQVAVGVLSNGFFSFCNQATTLARNFGQEYYIEVVVESTPDPVNPTVARTMFASFYVDDVLVKQHNLGTFAQNADFYVQATYGWASTSADNRARRWLIGDLYVTDINGEVPYNNRLGPQKVLPVYASQDVNSTWTPSSGTDRSAMINEADGRNDATYLTAPVDNADQKFKFDFKTTALSQVNGLRFFARAKRDAGGGRPLRVELQDQANAVIGTPVNATLSATFADYDMGTIYPTNAADAQKINHGALQNAVLNVRALTS